MVTDPGTNLPLRKKRDPSHRVGETADTHLWQAVFNGVDCGLLVLAEPSETIVDANAAICDYWQIPRGELLGLRLGQVVTARTDLESQSPILSGQVMRGPAAGRDVQWRVQSIGGAEPGTSVAIFSGTGAPSEKPESSRRDATTGLPNRQELEHELARRIPAGNLPFALLFLDLDGFKEVNDRFGHLAGDDVLREVGRRLAAVVRENDLVARYGGDEFVVLAEGISTARDAARIARRVSAALEHPISLEKPRRGVTEVQLGVSIGLALAGDNPGSARSLLEKADRDMYRRKRLRRRRALNAVAQQN
jgi:diguanylate cyclase (GGDEF)-like protein